MFWLITTSTHAAFTVPVAAVRLPLLQCSKEYVLKAYSLNKDSLMERIACTAVQ